jgi:hypothetical protein
MCITEMNLHGKCKRPAHMRANRGEAGGKVVGGGGVLFVPKTETFDRVSLREPAHANVLVPVCGDDVRFVG